MAPRRDRFTSPPLLPSAVTLLALAVVCLPTSVSAQTVRVPQGDYAFSSAPLGTDAVIQQEGFIALTEAAQKAMNKLIGLYGHGDYSRVTTQALQELKTLLGNPNAPDANAAVPTQAVIYRVGMFFEYVTPNMLRLFSMSRTATSCSMELQQVAQVVVKELDQVEKDTNRKGGNGAVFGRSAVTAAKNKAHCPQG